MFSRAACLWRADPKRLVFKVRHWTDADPAINLSTFEFAKLASAQKSVLELATGDAAQIGRLCGLACSLAVKFSKGGTVWIDLF